MTAIEEILARTDAGQDVAMIADALDLSQGYVYGVLREHRPKRKRKTHRQWSHYRDEIVRLAKEEGMNAPEIADELNITRACVYKWLPKAPPPCPVPLPK
jgi:DNA invertase Pin-like site-specific DNA recombinase